MAIDHYSPCPCGSGKKLKFCKCVDNPQDFEKLVRLIEGGQEVAALDRINQLLKKTPNTAWLLAIKGELTLAMQEIDSFRETANRFLKLKPDNPLALIMQSIVCAIDQQPLENAARFLLEGMAESRESLPALALSAIQILIRSLASTGRLSMVGYWADALAALTSAEETDESVLRHPELNLIAKSPSKLIDDPAGAPWKERLAEVLALVRSFRYDQAEKKLHAILRDFPNQPGPLSHLLRAQYAQLDQHGAVATARKLAEHPGLSEADRGYFAAIAFEVEPEQVSLRTKMLVRYCEIDSEERVSEAMEKLDFAAIAEDEATEQARHYFAAAVQDEVPARKLYNIYDRAMPADASESVVVSTIGTVAIFAKQTDRPARALLVVNEISNYQGLIAQVLDALQLGPSASDAELPLQSIYTDFLTRMRMLSGSSDMGLPIDVYGQVVVEEFLTLPVAALDFKTPAEAVGDEKHHIALLGLLAHFEGYQAIVLPANTINEIYARLELQRPRVDVRQDATTLKLVNVLELERIDLEKISSSQLRGLMLRALSLGATRVTYRCALRIVETPELMHDYQLQLLSLSNLLNVEPSLEKKLEIGYALEPKLVEAKAPVGRLIIQRVSILHALGQSEKGQETMVEAIKKYPDDPYLLSFLQYAMQGGQAPGSATDPLASRMLNSSRAAENSGGLVLPGQPSSAPSESKLWLPGS